MPRARRSLTLTLEGGRGRRGSPPRVGLLRRRCSAPACGGTLRSGDTSRPPIQAGIRPRRRGRSAFIGPSGATPSVPARARRLALHYAPTVFEHQTSAGAAETELISRRVLLHSLFRTKGSRRCPVYVPTECPCWTRGSRRCPVDAPAECRCPYWTRGSGRCRAGRTGTLPLRAPPTSVAVSHLLLLPGTSVPVLDCVAAPLWPPARPTDRRTTRPTQVRIRRRTGCGATCGQKIKDLDSASNHFRVG